MKLASLFGRRDNQPLGVGRMTQAVNALKDMPDQYGLLREIQARLSGLGEPPQFGNRVVLKDIQNAIRMAELGETYYMFALFRDMTENDPHLQAEMGKRVMSFMGQQETIEPFNVKDEDDNIAVEVIEDMRENCENWDEGSVHLALGHIWPISGAEKIYRAVEPEERHNFRHPVASKIHEIHPIPWPLYTYKVAYWNVGLSGGSPQDLLTQQGAQIGTGSIPINNPAGLVAYHVNIKVENDVLQWNPQDWHPDLRFYGTLSNGVIDWTLSTGYKPDKIRHILHRAQVATSGIRDNFGATMRALIPIWFYKRNLIDWYMQSMERYGAPFVVAQARIADKNVSDILTKALNQASVLRALLVPPGTKIQLEQAQTSGMSDGFAKAIEVLNMEETKAILGITMATSNKGNGLSGGSGQADLQGDVKEEWSLYDKRRYCNMQRTQIFNQYLMVNGYRGRCRSVRGGISAQQQALVAKTYLQLFQAGWRPLADEAPKMTNTFGIKLERFDPQAEKAQPLAGDKIPKDDSK